MVLIKEKVYTFSYAESIYKKHIERNLTEEELKIAKFFFDIGKMSVSTRIKEALGLE